MRPRGAKPMVKRGGCDQSRMPNSTTYVALLRGINVGGNKPIAMPALREMLAQLGFDDVRSILQSGNLVFRSSTRALDALHQRGWTGS